MIKHETDLGSLSVVRLLAGGVVREAATSASSSRLGRGLQSQLVPQASPLSCCRSRSREEVESGIRLADVSLFSLEGGSEEENVDVSLLRGSRIVSIVIRLVFQSSEQRHAEAFVRCRRDTRG